MEQGCIIVTAQFCAVITIFGESQRRYSLFMGFLEIVLCRLG